MLSKGHLGPNILSKIKGKLILNTLTLNHIKLN